MFVLANGLGKCILHVFGQALVLGLLPLGFVLTLFTLATRIKIPTSLLNSLRESRLSHRPSLLLIFLRAFRV